MRTVSATLAAAQYAASRTPYIRMVFTSYDGLTTYDLSTNSSAYGNRIILIDHTEESYNEFATILLRDYDRALPTDITGYWVEIGYGDVTGVGNEYASTARLWVKHHQHVSAAGKCIVLLELEGMWAKCRETKLRMGTPPFYSITQTTSTVLEIMQAVAAEILPAFTITQVQTDGILDMYTPNFSINQVQMFEDAASVLYRLIKMTKCYLRPKPTLTFDTRYPQTSESADVTYYSYQAPYFYQYADRKSLKIPNHIYVIANSGADGLYTDIIIAEATDTDSVAKYGDQPDIALAPEITSSADALNRADAILAKVGEEESAGSITVPHDCRVELYDKVQVDDARGY